MKNRIQPPHSLQMFTKRNLPALSVAVLGILAFSPLDSHAVTRNWDNSATSFNLGTSWVGGVAPNASDVGAFVGAPAFNPNVTASLTIQGVTFDTGGYTLSSAGGAILSFNSATGISATNTSGTTTISANIDLARVGTAAVGFNQASGGALNISGNISQSVGTGVLQLTGVGTFTLSGNNSHANGTNFGSSNMRLNINSATALGTGALNSATNGNTINNTSGSAITVANALNITNAAAGSTIVNSLTFDGGNNLTFGGLTTFGGNASRSIAVNNGILTLNGGIAESIVGSSLTKNGGGTLVLGGAVNYTGTTLVNAGTLLLGGGSLASTAVTVANGAAFGGSGATNSLTLNNGSTYVFEGGDLVDVNGLLTLNDNWTLTLGTGFQDGGSVTLFTYDSLASGADLLPTINDAGLGFDPSSELFLSIVGNSIVLNGISVIPEPASAALFGIGMMAVFYRARRRSQG